MGTEINGRVGTCKGRYTLDQVVAGSGADELYSASLIDFGLRL
jgi:hypothetical protein